MLVDAIRDLEVLGNCSDEVAFLIREDWKRRLLTNSAQRAACLEVWKRCSGRCDGVVPVATDRMELRVLRGEVMKGFVGELYGTFEEYMDYCGWVNGCEPVTG